MVPFRVKWRRSRQPHPHPLPRRAGPISSPIIPPTRGCHSERKRRIRGRRPQKQDKIEAFGLGFFAFAQNDTPRNGQKNRTDRPCPRRGGGPDSVSIKGNMSASPSPIWAPDYPHIDRKKSHLTSVPPSLGWPYYCPQPHPIPQMGGALDSASIKGNMSASPPSPSGQGRSVLKSLP
jgi:hypothetical protein